MDYRALVDMAILAGEIMLISGAEVYRIEDTVSRILKTSRLESIEVFALATGIFATLSDPSVGAITLVKRVNKRATNLNRIYCVNDVSRRFCGGIISVEEAYMELREIAEKIQYGKRKKVLGYMMTAAFFAVLFDGGIFECITAGGVGAVLGLVVLWTAKLRLNDFCQNAASSFAMAVIVLLIQKFLILSMNIDAVIISAIMPVVPGVIFTSAIRDTLNGDYSSGVARMGEAVVVALAVACGVGSAMMIFQKLGGML